MTAAKELIQSSNGNMNEITTRMIAEKAGVGVGLINYHFHTKDNLVELCVQSIISDVVQRFRPNLEAGLEPRERLKKAVKLVADFLADNPSLSRISVLADHAKPGYHDNTMNTVTGLLALWSNGGEEETSQESHKLMMFSLVSLIQAAMLRREMTASLMGFDFDKKEERDRFLDFLVDRLFPGGSQA